MGYGPITSWQIDEETIGTVRDYGAPKSLRTVTESESEVAQLCPPLCNTMDRGAH